MHVGVFLIAVAVVLPLLSLPHACGGVSMIRKWIELQHTSSPCMWGCFYNQNYYQIKLFVFPMHVGVFLNLHNQRGLLKSLPHACGGVS